MALIDAGISVSGFVSSATVAISSNSHSTGSGMDVDSKTTESDILLDPTTAQAKKAGALMTIAWDQRGRQVYSEYKLQYDPDTPVDADEQDEKYWRAVELSKKAAAKTLNFQRQTMQQKVIYESSFALNDTKAPKKD